MLLKDMSKSPNEFYLSSCLNDSVYFSLQFVLINQNLKEHELSGRISFTLTGRLDFDVGLI